MSSTSRTDQIAPGCAQDYPLTFSVDYPDRDLNRLTSALRIFTIIPIALLAATVEGGSYSTGTGSRYVGGGVGVLVIPVLLMLLFRKRYPRGGMTGTCSSAASATESSPTCC